MNLNDSRWASHSRSQPSTARLKSSSLFGLSAHQPSPPGSSSFNPQQQPTTSAATITPVQFATITSNSTNHTASASPSKSVSTPASTRRIELTKHTRLLRRLQWKTTLLYLSYQRARYPSAQAWSSLPSFVPQHVASSSMREDDGTGSHPNDTTDGESGESQEWTPVSAEAMFKLDFFEYFVLLERVLVHLLGALNVSIPRYGNDTISSLEDETNNSSNANTSTKNTSTNTTSTAAEPSTPAIFATRGRIPITLPTLSAASSSSATYQSYSYSSTTHRFHANVLLALELPSNPVRNILGTGEVRRYLGIAKECRNRWKEADEQDRKDIEEQKKKGHNGNGDALKHDGGNKSSGPNDSETKFLNILAEIDLERMLSCIIEGLERTRFVAEGVVARVELDEKNSITGSGGKNGLVQQQQQQDLAQSVSARYQDTGEMEWDSGDAGGEVPWEAVPDAMELDFED